ncbi:hypothetical protein NDU88_004183 [Pleurodeles waltl]|uniref:Uncharacterized protein n=1 Tax=Pleurodeles waltl TaxID=8319 RepID=A0AAV7W912_PLEWA|nr:hypothetical protein NDU88_004183 [Pleurodeles waltl]
MMHAPSIADLMAVIQGPKAEVDHKNDAVAIEVNLLCVDLRKVSEGLAQAEKNVEILQQELPDHDWSQQARILPSPRDDCLIRIGKRPRERVWQVAAPLVQLGFV